MKVSHTQRDGTFNLSQVLTPQEVFCYPNTLQEIPPTVSEPLSKLVCDVHGAVEYKKPGAFQILLLLPRLITPHTAKKKWATRWITTNIHLLREGKMRHPPGEATKPQAP